MSYLGEVYVRIYTIMTSFWWKTWVILFLCFLFSLIPIHIVKCKFKGQYTYFGILFFSITFFVGLIGWVFLPSPELLGLKR